MKLVIFKKIFFIIIAFLAIGFFGYLFWRYAYRSKASEVKATFSFSQNEVAFKQNEEKEIGFTLTTENPTTYKISAVDLYFKFDSSNNNLLDFVDFSAKYPNSTNDYFNDIIKKEVTFSDGAKILRITATAKRADSELSGAIFFNLKFKAKKTQGENAISLIETPSQVVGITGSSDHLFKLQLGQISFTSYTVGNDAVCSQSQDCGANASCNSGSCQCSQGFYNCDGNWSNGCESTLPCGQITPTPTPTSEEAGNVTLNLKLKFQGITKKPVAEFNRLKVKVTVVSAGGERKEGFADFSADEKGLWLGSLSFNLTEGQGYTILIKGPKHIQKKICDQTPSESRLGPGTYVCGGGRGKIVLHQGANDLDFSGIYLLSGDLPVAGEQDGVVNSLDTSFIRNNLGSRSPQVLATGDINLDGVVDTQDWSLVITALSVRGDEE